MVYLDFEQPIKEITEQLEDLSSIGEKGNVNITKARAELKKKLDTVTKKVYENLTPWQRVQVSRHPQRPYTLDYIKAMTRGNFIELHGDRNVSDDKAMVGGFGKLDNETVMFIGHQKGKDTKERQYRNFGMANPEGYRKALRLMRLAEKFNKPIVTLIDTPGAFPGVEAEERGQGEAIARNIYEMMTIKVPIIVIIIGEGASGGALGIGIGDKVLMLENSWYSVISPENCSTILWRNWDHKVEAAEVLNLTADNMKQNKLIDGIIKEPMGGAHSNPQMVAKTVRAQILKSIKTLGAKDIEKLLSERIKKFINMGVTK
ncbi:MAG: acetyl-CoA carboxylase carboxyl transferase subunit alpha [Patiriisocius sp.]|jgi:acetyl-CoA carboxylase carboxyl transferase subunit alpha